MILISRANHDPSICRCALFLHLVLYRKSGHHLVTTCFFIDLLSLDLCLIFLEIMESSTSDLAPCSVLEGYQIKLGENFDHGVFDWRLSHVLFEINMVEVVLLT
jgi:hypothetical protein